MPSITADQIDDNINARRSSPEFRFRFLDHGAPAFARWLRSHGIKGKLNHDADGELVGFDVPDEWSADQTEEFAHWVLELVVDEATEKLAQLRGEPMGTALPSIAPLAADLRRIADHFDPQPPEVVGTEYVANRLGCTLTWIADLVRQGEIPRSSIVQGTGNGKPWKFHRHLIDRWIETR